VAISVTDNGSGMAAETMAKIFDPFFTTKAAGDGTGLGLSMVYGFVKQSDGDITVSSSLGRGTMFRLYFPTPRAVDDSVDEDAPKVSEKATILLVEDDADVRDMTVRILLRKGYDVVCASSAEDALGRLGSGTRFDLLLTDIILPGGMDGGQLANQARKVRPDLNLLFMSGYARDAFSKESHLLADIQLIKKPFLSETLIASVRSVLAPQPTHC
jgi:CheY-like chemotaxis protein